jgi:putative colanic acid biosynthesis UDP-glucose lipid carrier transferase
MAVTDSLCSSMALLIAADAVAGALPRGLIVIVVVSPLVVWAIFSWLRLYQTHLLAPAEEFRRLLIGVSLASLALVTFSFWADVPYSRLWVAVSIVLALTFTLASRRFWHWAVFRERLRHGRFTFRTAVVGTNGEARRLARVLRGGNLGFLPIGFVAPDGNEPVDDLRVIGSVRGLRAAIDSHAVESVFVATTAVSLEQIAAVQKAARRARIDVHVTANLPELLASRIAVEPLGGVMALSLRPVRLTGRQAAAKRAFDVLLGTVALSLSAPAWLLAAGLVRATSPGPVLFRQRRVGRHGRPFTLLKFRTMVADAEDRLAEVRHRNEADGPLFKLRDDPRVTWTGRLLRRASLDELPQLVNVVRGDMSLVGPRPHAVFHHEHYRRLIQSYMKRHRVKPGITGWAQVNGWRGPTDTLEKMQRRIEFDLHYIENWSLGLDLRILWLTLWRGFWDPNGC